VISPEKIFATVVAERKTSFFAGRFTSTAIGAAMIGAWNTVERFVAAV